MKATVLIAFLTFAWAAPRDLVLPGLKLKLKNVAHHMTSDRIVGGTEVVPNSLPFQISLQRKDVIGGYTQLCGGTILTASTILSSAHCVDGYPLDTLLVVAGEHSLSSTSGLEQNRLVKSVTIHPKFNTTTFENDISLIHLSEPFDLSVPQVKAVNLPPPTSQLDPPAGTIVTVSGWGVTAETDENFSDTLRSVDVPVVSDVECNKIYGAVFGLIVRIYPSMICAGNVANGGADSCSGDAGGPLFTGTGAEAIQHGITSFGNGCALPGYPGVYTQVSYFLDWIAENLVQ